VKRIFILIAVFVILLVILGVYLSNTNSENGGIIEYSGTVEAREVELSFKAAGRLEYIKYDEGDNIAEGDTVAELSHNEILAQIQMSDDAILSAKAQLRSLKVEKESVQRNLKKVNNLIPSGGATVGKKEDLEDRIRGLDAAISAGSSGIKAAESKKEYLQVLYENEYLISALSGTVLIRSMEQGEVVNPGQTVLTVADLQRLDIKIYVPEEFLGKIRQDQNVIIKVDSYPDKDLNGIISKISDKAEFTPKSIQTKQERVKTVYAVTIRADNSGGILKPGMPCDVILDVTE
jgi:HlyD family secretion protein